MTPTLRQETDAPEVRDESGLPFDSVANAPAADIGSEAERRPLALEEKMRFRPLAMFAGPVSGPAITSQIDLF